MISSAEIVCFMLLFCPFYYLSFTSSVQFHASKWILQSPLVFFSAWWPRYWNHVYSHYYNFCLNVIYIGITWMSSLTSHLTMIKNDIILSRYSLWSQILPKISPEFGLHGSIVLEWHLVLQFAYTQLRLGKFFFIITSFIIY